MGLDHGLTRRHYVKNWDYMKPEERHEVTVKLGGKPYPKSQLDESKIKYLSEDVIQWRKSNQIHQWFVENVQRGVDNCAIYYVGADHLKNLVGLIEEVLADHSRASELLPTQEGFFFGGTTYDEHYFGDLEEALPVLRAVIGDKGGEFEYWSSW